MALAPRPASRFFAAFYRWSRHTQRPSPCTFSSRSCHVPRRPATFANVRSYHVGRRLCEEDQSIHGFLQEDETSVEEIGAEETSAEETSAEETSAIEPAVDPAQLKDDVRRLMRKVPASVAVITVAHYDPELDMNVPMGIAVSSLNTVTLDPPTVSFNIKEPSKALTAIRAANGGFRVHFFESHEAALDIIEHFCNGNHPDAYDQRLEALSIHVPQVEDSIAATASLAPQIQGMAIRAAAECTLTQELTVGDHVILVAQIKSLESKDMETPTIAYVNGSYRRLASKGMLGYHGKQQDPEQPAAQQQDVAQTEARQTKTDRAHELSIAYDYSLIPGEQDRHEYAERLKSYIRGIQGLRFLSSRDLIKDLRSQTRLVSKSFGIDLVALIKTCQNETSETSQQILPEFYMHLSSAKMAKLLDRVKQLVKADARFLEVSCTDLFHYLDVHIGGTSILPSDLLNPLRAEGLVGPFESSESLLETTGPDRNILAMEQAEHAIREQLSTLTDKEILRINLLTIMDRAGVERADFMHFREAHTRLQVEMCSRFYEDWEIDITGDATPEETLVVIRRLVDYLGIGRREVYRAHMLEHADTIMRNIGVDPLLAGVNATFIISKIRYLYSTVDFPSLKDRVEEMLQPYFASSITWDDLETRIKQFVQKLPLRATTWKNRDIMAAMGVSGKTIISTPLSTTPQTLDDSNLLDMRVAKALKDHYGNGTDEENQAIATFLKDRYGFDVARRSATVTLEEALARSSADDLEAARRKHQEVMVPIRKMDSKSSDNLEAARLKHQEVIIPIRKMGSKW